MNRRLFGTDGLRGKVNIYPMVPEVALRLGLAAGTYFRNGKKRHKVVIGKDTRLSGYIFETALTSGFCAAGMNVFLVGPMPTPAISFLTRNMRADVGVVISASHNPFYDNGIKFFDSHGFKLPDDVEESITDMVLNHNSIGEQWNYPMPEDVGRAFKIEDSPGRYIVYLKNSFPPQLTLDGVKVVLDCAHGATYRVAPLIFEELGATVIKVGNEPNGLNINDNCGSLHPELASRLVREHNADIGITLDGDGDRLIVVDEKGAILDGDQVMAICAQDFLDRQAMPGKKLVTTVMSNMALEVFMQERGGSLIRTPVGDRYVFEAMLNEGAVFGGEQSGHLIFREYATTGDGILASLQLLRIMMENNKRLSELSGLLTPFPQVLKNVKVSHKKPFSEVPAIIEAKESAEKALSGKGRVLLRYSGTEPLARIMVEGENAQRVEQLADDLLEVLIRNLV